MGKGVAMMTLIKSDVQNALDNCLFNHPEPIGLHALLVGEVR